MPSNVLLLVVGGSFNERHDDVRSHFSQWKKAGRHLWKWSLRAPAGRADATSDSRTSRRHRTAAQKEHSRAEESRSARKIHHLRLGAINQTSLFSHLHGTCATEARGPSLDNSWCYYSHSTCADIYCCRHVVLSFLSITNVSWCIPGVGISVPDRSAQHWTTHNNCRHVTIHTVRLSGTLMLLWHHWKKF